MDIIMEKCKLKPNSYSSFFDDSSLGVAKHNRLIDPTSPEFSSKASACWIPWVYLLTTPIKEPVLNSQAHNLQLTQGGTNSVMLRLQ